MILHVVKAEYISEYKIFCRFNDGNDGVVDLFDMELLTGPVFGPLVNIDNFKNFTLCTELNTIVWYNGADLAPEYLESKILINH